MLHRNFLLILSSFCFTFCGHHLSPRIAIVVSLGGAMVLIKDTYLVLGMGGGGVRVT